MAAFRTIDGTENNGNQGEANKQLIRLFDNAFDDGISVPRGGEFDQSVLPNPRTISNIVVVQVEDAPNFLNASDWLWQWGQFLDHDFALNEASGEEPPTPEDFTPIVVADGDPTFPDGTELPFIRVPAAEGTGKRTPRQINNQVTAFLDASSVYGSDEERAEFLRVDEYDPDFGKGLLKTTVGDNGEILLPFNLTGDEALPNSTGGLLGEVQYIAGDVRVNEQIGLTAVHTLFVREHNRLAEELHERLEDGDEDLEEKFEDFLEDAGFDLDDFDDDDDDDFDDDDDGNFNEGGDFGGLKDEFLYQAARQVVAAEVQVITYNEFLPLLIGEGTVEEYEGFDSDINPQVSVEFADAAFRVGHTLLSNQLLRVDGEGNTIAEIPLADAFFDPNEITENGVDSLLAGLASQTAEEIDNLLVDGVREFLFPAGTGGLDLAAINIARGREVGLPGYADTYEDIFGTEITDFDDLGSNGLGLFDDRVVSLFDQAYESVDQIDLWLGGISELPDDHGGLLGPTLSFFIADQFTRARDGDEFFYLQEEQLEHLEILSPGIQDVTLSDIINLNSSITVQENAFLVPQDIQDIVV